MNILSKSPAKTKVLGEKLGQRLKKGDVIALIGELGAGKTCFTQGLMKGLDVQKKSVTSPTFIIMNVYKGRVPVYHFDVYRINNISEIVDLGYEEYFYGNGVTIIEWADKIKELLPKEVIKVRLKIAGEKERRISIKGADLTNANIRNRNSN